jgi:hypothetical protein
MADEAEREVPEGAALFPLIPPELDVHPLLLAVLHAVVFLDGSAETVVHPAAAEEALEYLATYLQRLHGPELERVQADLAALVGLARQQRWSKPEVQFLKDFLADFGVGDSSET